ncbi:MAG: ATP-grasp ribosomal peptide maturase [Mycobacteriales bacterium]
MLTSQYDTTADLVVRALNERAAPVFRCDTSQLLAGLDFTAELSNSAPRWLGHIRGPHRSVALENISCAYYRRPTAFATSGANQDTRDWIALQARLGFGGVLATTSRWLNHPSQIGYAEYKPVQFATAVHAGLSLPRTLITNDPAAAMQFGEDVGELVYKPLASAGASPGTAVYTNRVTTAQLNDPTIRQTAHLFQEWVRKDHEVRLTMVDQRCFATAITAHSAAAKVDWRTDYASLSYRPVDTPPHVRNGMLALLGALGLRFAAADFAVTSEGKWIFLDLNPNGQWAWIAERTGVDIAGAIADALIGTPVER